MLAIYKGFNVTEKEICKKVGGVINNATDWEGHRKNREKKETTGKNPDENISQ